MKNEPRKKRRLTPSETLAFERACNMIAFAILAAAAIIAGR